MAMNMNNPQQVQVQPQVAPAPAVAPAAVDPMQQMQQFFSQPQQNPATPALYGQEPAPAATPVDTNPVFYIGGGNGETAPQPAPVQQQQFQQVVPQVSYQQPQTQLLPDGTQYPVNPQQQTMDYNQLFQPQNQPVQQQSEGELAKILQQQTQLIQQLAEKQNNSGQPDYLNMDSQELLNLINGNEETGQGSKLKDILSSIQQSAVKQASSTYQSEIENMKHSLEVMQRQHSQITSKSAINNLVSKYSQRDPNFQQNLLEVSKILADDNRRQFFDSDPNGSLETAYLSILAKQFATPGYNQQLAQQQMNLPSNGGINPNVQQVHKMQAGVAGTPVMQNPTPFPVQQQQALVPQGKSDNDVLRDILNMGGYGIPNVAVNV